MGLRADQSKKVLELHLEGVSAEDISKQLGVSISDVQPFIPTGALAVSYQKVTAALLKMNEAQAIADAAEETDRQLAIDAKNCKAATEVMEEAILAAETELKSMRSVLKQVTQRGEEVEGLLDKSPARRKIAAHLKAKKEYDAQALKLDKEKADAAAAKKRAAKKAEMIAKAQKMAEQVVISAAIAGAQETVAKTIAAQLDKEERDNA